MWHRSALASTTLALASANTKRKSTFYARRRCGSIHGHQAPSLLASLGRASALTRAAFERRRPRPLLERATEEGRRDCKSSTVNLAPQSLQFRVDKRPQVP